MNNINLQAVNRLSNKWVFCAYSPYFCKRILMQQQHGDLANSHKNQHHKITVEEGLPYIADGLPQLHVMGIRRTVMNTFSFDSLKLFG